jgi:hypothetical protein
VAPWLGGSGSLEGVNISLTLKSRINSQTNKCIWDARNRTQRSCAISRLRRLLRNGFWNTCKEPLIAMRRRFRGVVNLPEGLVGEVNQSHRYLVAVQF